MKVLLNREQALTFKWQNGYPLFPTEVTDEPIFDILADGSAGDDELEMRVAWQLRL